MYLGRETFCLETGLSIQVETHLARQMTVMVLASKLHIAGRVAKKATPVTMILQRCTCSVGELLDMDNKDKHTCRHTCI